MPKGKGWDYLNSDDINETFNPDDESTGWGYKNENGSGSYYGDDGSWGYQNADRSGSYYGADGSWGYKNSDGSGSFYGANGSWGHKNSDGSGSFYGANGSWRNKKSDGSCSYYGDGGSSSFDDAEQEDEEDEDNDSSSGVSFEEALGNAVGLVLGVGMTAVIAMEKEKEAQKEAESRERRARRKVWRGQHRKGLLILYLICFLVLSGIIGYCELSIRIPVGYDKHDLIGNDYQSVIRQLERAGFRYVSGEAVEDLSVDEIQDDSLVFDVKIGWSNSFNEESKYPANFPVKVIYHSLETLDVPISSKEANKSDYETVLKKFQNAGFTNIKTETRYDIITGWISNDGDIKSVTINGDKKFYESSSYRADVEVVITYHTLKKNKPK